MLIPGHGYRLRRGPRRGLTGLRVERHAAAGHADQFGAVAISQRPGHERPGPATARDPPPHLEHRPAGPAPDREHPHIERAHQRPLEPTGTSRPRPHHRNTSLPGYLPPRHPGYHLLRAGPGQLKGKNHLSPGPACRRERAAARSPRNVTPSSADATREAIREAQACQPHHNDAG